MQKVEFTKLLISPLFKRYIYLIFGSVPYAEKQIKRLYDIEVEYHGNDACVESVEKCGVYQYILFIDNRNWNYRIKDYSILAHECFHLAFRIQQYITGNDDSYKLSDDLNEHTGYMIEAIYEMILKEITKKYKYKK